LAIYSRCLSVVYSPPTYPGTGSKRKVEVQDCYRWNDGLPCNGASCKFAHKCSHCGGLNKASIEISMQPSKSRWRCTKHLHPVISVEPIWLFSPASHGDWRLGLADYQEDHWQTTTPLTASMGLAVCSQTLIQMG